jgi:hypothetical protein
MEDVRLHALYRTFRQVVLECLERCDRNLGPGLLRLQFQSEERPTIVKTRQGSLRCGYGVEAAMWYAHEPEEGTTSLSLLIFCRAARSSKS